MQTYFYDQKRRGCGLGSIPQILRYS